MQWCRGLDGRIDPSRIAREVRQMGGFDVICLQEIADHFPDRLLKGSLGENRFALLDELFDGYSSVQCVAVDHPADDGGRRRFGKLVPSRPPPRRTCGWSHPSTIRHRCWSTRGRSRMPQPPTFCVHASYAQGMLQYACDCARVNTPLRARVRDMVIDSATRDSDHQPLIIILG